MGQAWVYVINTGGGTPAIRRRSDPAITVAQEQPGVYAVTLPAGARDVACVATLGNSVGTITAIPGDGSPLAPNQVRVLTLSLDNHFVGALDFCLAAFWADGPPPDTVSEPGGF